MKTSIVLVLAAGFAAACAPNPRQPDSAVSTTTITSATVPVSADRAVNRVAEARCDRELACDNIGSGHHWESREACLLDLKKDLREKLGSRECANGVDRDRLNACLKESRTEQCGNPVDGVERASACGTSELCLGH